MRFYYLPDEEFPDPGHWRAEDFDRYWRLRIGQPRDAGDNFVAGLAVSYMKALEETK